MDVQIEMTRSVKGLENAKIMRFGYAIEYDFVIPTQLKPTLEAKTIQGLYMAGQINGTSGYEEAAAQGLMAGINAALKIKAKEPLVLSRSDAYIGVLIDDLVTKGVIEPYRVLTSRAEYRLLLRQDNADLRMMDTGHAIGLVSDERYKKFLEKKKMIEDEIRRLESVKITPTAKINKALEKLETAVLNSPSTLAELLKRPELDYKKLEILDEHRKELPAEVIEQVEISTAYEGYIKRQIAQVEQFKKMENKRIPEDINYDEIYGLGFEAREKLKKIKPLSIGQASRIAGVNPSDITVMMIHLETRRRKGFHE